MRDHDRGGQRRHDDAHAIAERRVGVAAFDREPDPGSTLKQIARVTDHVTDALDFEVALSKDDVKIGFQSAVGTKLMTSALCG